jgi:Ni2+-binding GTPase involved in maturation of urease and hydrogenase
MLESTTVPAPNPVSLVLLGGFLGAGKTTAIVQIAMRWIAKGRRVGVIANDQAADLVDTATFRLQGLQTSEVAGGCFCCRYDEFIARAGELVDEHRPDVIIAEPVGSCVDLVATIINPIERLCARRFVLAPYTVLLDPIRACRVLGREEPVGLSERVTYIFRMQQQEAAAIAISKIDLLGSRERDRIVALVREHFPGRETLMFSATTGEGLDELMSWLDSQGARGQALADIDYDVYAAGEAELGWLNSVISVEGDSPVDVDALLLELAQALQSALRDAACEIAHGKLLLDAGGLTAAVSLVDHDSSVVLSRRAATSARSFTLTINLRVQADPVVLGDLLHRCLDEWTERHDLTIVGGSGQSFRPARPEPTHRLLSQ